MNVLNKKILVLSFYFQPDLCAGSFRCTSLVEELSKHDLKVHVITSSPNRYKSFKKKSLSSEVHDNVKIDRVFVPTHNSGILDQAMSFIYFYRGAKKLAARNDYDLVFATSSRLFTAFLGARISNAKHIPLYLDIRDLFIDTLKEIIPLWISFLLKPLLKLIEKYTFSSADKINLVSKGFKPCFDERYPDIPYSFFTNGIDKEFIDIPKLTENKKNIKESVNILYAGNIGEGQGLHKIIPQFANELKDRIHFKVIGEGGLVQKLHDQVNRFKLRNVEIIPPLDRDKLIEEYLKCDVLFVHLNDYDVFKKVLPSKLFEYAAISKPILAGIDGYSADFVKSEISNCEIFSPGNLEQAIIKFNKLNFEISPRKEFIEKFDRRKIMDKMALDIYEFS